MVFCPAVTCDVGESDGKLCALCGVGCLTAVNTVHTACQPTLQHHNSHNMTENDRQ